MNKLSREALHELLEITKPIQDWLDEHYDGSTSHYVAIDVESFDVGTRIFSTELGLDD